MFLIVLIPLIFASETYTATTKTICNNNICTKTLYSGVMFAQNSSGDWVNPSDVLSITKNSDDLTFVYDGIKGQYDITFETGVIYNDNYYSMADVKGIYPQIQFTFPTKKYDTYRKYAVNITDIPSNVQSNLQYITLTYKSHNGFTLEQLKKSENKYLVKDIFILLFNDLIENNFTVSINKSEKRIYIGNLSDKFVDNSLYLDPTIQLQDADTENLDDSTVDELNPSKELGANVHLYIGSNLYQAFHFFIKFNILSIPMGNEIDNATLSLHISSDTFDIGEGWNFTIHHVYSYPTYNISDKEWIEGSSSAWTTATAPEISYDWRPINEEYNATAETNGEILQGDTGWKTYDITNMVNKEYIENDKNISIWFKQDSPIGGATDDYAYFYSKEYTTDTALRPYLNITYSADITLPTYSNLKNNASVTTKYNGTVNFSVDLVDNLNLDYYIFADNTSRVMENRTPIDISGTSYSANYSLFVNLTRGNYVCGQFWFNDTSGNVNQTNMSCFTVANTLPNVTIVLKPAPVDTTDDLNGTITYSDADSDDWTFNETKWYNDGVEVTDLINLTSISYTNTTGSEIWIFSARVYDSFNWSIWVNSSPLTIGDATPPEIIDITFSAGTSFYSDVTQNITINCTDADSSISWAKYTLNTTGTLENKSMTNVGGDIYSQAATYGVGTYTVTKFFCQDSSGNLNTTDSNTELTVTTRPTPSVPPSGGGAPAIRCEEWELLYLGQCLNATWFNITLNIIFPPTQRVDQFNFYYTGKKETDWKFTVLLNKKIRTVNISENTFFLNATIVENEVFLFGKIERFTSLARLDTATIRYTDITGLIKYSTVTIRSYNVWTGIVYLLIISLIVVIVRQVRKKKIKFLERFRKK